MTSLLLFDYVTKVLFTYFIDYLDYRYTIIATINITLTPMFKEQDDFY